MERLLEAKNMEKDSGQDIQLKVSQKLYLVGYILYKTSSSGLSSSFPVQELRISLVYPISIVHQKQRSWMTFGIVQHGIAWVYLQ